MSLIITITAAATFLILGLAGGWFLVARLGRGRLQDAKALAEDTISQAREEAAALKKTVALEVRDEWRREREPLEREMESSKKALRELETKLHGREQQLDRKVDILESKEQTLLKLEEEISNREQTIVNEEARAQEQEAIHLQRMEELAGMSREDVLAMLIRGQEERARRIAARKVREISDSAIANANREAKEIIARSIQRFAGELSLESTVSVVTLPTDEMKGRIIGRDGRNIRSLDMVTGVEVIVDDTPGMVMLSSFDPLRREIARNTLEKLIVDGRIHPGRIEEVYEKAREDVEDLVRESGSKAAFDLGIHDLAEPLLELLGKLRFRTSYGQNLLAHSKEVGILAGTMAEELGMNANVARRAGLLHDISKALDHDIGSDPTQSSAALAVKCGESEEVIEVIETHSQDTPRRQALAILVQAADAISSGRPGAHKEKVEEYIRRLKQIEKIASSHPGVDNAFALQNGREVRVLVDSTSVDDVYAEQLADEVTEALEEEVGQSGHIKVCVIREVRAIHIAR